MWAVKRLSIAAVVFLLAAPAMFVVYQGIRTLRVLTVVERERDQWQRPDDILRALALTEGATVVDLGSGAGYFALKLSPIVGARGAVLAEDVRRQSLTFLWIRRFLRDARNVRVIHGEPNDPHLPAGTADAVLIANTYHELAAPGPILDAVFRAMKPGARLVIVDRRLRTARADATEAGHHGVSSERVHEEIRLHGFEPLAREEPFIDRPQDDDVWWMIVARKARPQALQIASGESRRWEPVHLRVAWEKRTRSEAIMARALRVHRPLRRRHAVHGVRARS
jgi:predicted methyltransferase